MAITQKTLRIDVSTEQSYAYLKCRENDENSRIYKIIITERNKPIALKGTELVMASMIRNDTSYADTTCVWENGELFLTMTEGMLRIAGESLMEFRIYDSTDMSVLSTVVVHVDIQTSVLPQDRMIASDEFNVLNNLILQVTEAINAVGNIGDSVAELEQKTQDAIDSLDGIQNNLNELTEEAQSLVEDLSSTIEDIKTAENERIANELQRIENENTRKDTEALRETAENERISAENIRSENEITRQTNETNRSDAETIREANEQVRIENENARIEAENLRKANEDLRNDSEENRINSENERIDAENIRIANEELRQQQEIDRHSSTTTTIENAEKATDRANVAAKACEEIVAGTGFISITEKGTANGIAELDSTGKVPASQLPEIVDYDSILNDSKEYTDSVVNELIGTSPENLNTIHELASAIQDEQSAVDAIEESITNKVDKVSGKGLSTNDYTTEDKTKLSDLGIIVENIIDGTQQVGNAQTLDGYSSDEFISKTGDSTIDGNLTAKTFIGDLAGVADVAHSLYATNLMNVDLESSDMAEFTGDCDVTLGVTGTLPIDNGGTGATTATDARANLGITPENIGAASVEQLENCVLTKHKGDTEEGINEIYNNLHTNAQNDSVYRALVFHNVGHSILGGGTWYVEGYRSGATHGYQIARCYNSNLTTFKSYFRNLSNGTWGNWVRITSETDLVNYLPKSGGIISDTVVTPLTINSDISTDTRNLIGFNRQSVKQGYLGFNGVDIPSFVTAGGVPRELLHIGNYSTYVTPSNIGAAPLSHNQSASTITAGTFGGQVVAPAGTDYTTNRMRNIIFTTTDPGANATTSYANGSLICVYE